MLEEPGIIREVVLILLQILFWPLVQASFYEVGMIQIFAIGNVCVQICPGLTVLSL